jgi:hypothetical protein
MNKITNVAVKHHPANLFILKILIQTIWTKQLPLNSPSYPLLKKGKNPF